MTKDIVYDMVLSKKKTTKKSYSTPGKRWSLKNCVCVWVCKHTFLFSLSNILIHTYTPTQQTTNKAESKRVTAFFLHRQITGDFSLSVLPGAFRNKTVLLQWWSFITSGLIRMSQMRNHYRQVNTWQWQDGFKGRFNQSLKLYIARRSQALAIVSQTSTKFCN